MSEWQPIATAPKDGTRILAYGKMGFESELGIGTVKWDPPDRWVVDPNEATEYSPEPCALTHWMPLPLPPRDHSETPPPLSTKSLT
jgi:hypothetical protein